MSWSRIWGHALQKEHFQRILALGRVHHAYLFSGPSGVGKRTFSFEAAKALLCLEGKEEACDHCQSCILFERSAHPDFFLLAPERGSIGIDAVRGFVQRLSLKRILSSFKVGIIDEAEKLTEEAANCLLKTVEEPPQGVVLFLVTSQVIALPQTLLSRCQHFVFSPLPERVIAEYLEKEQGIESSRASTIAFFSLGSVGEALRCVQGKDLGKEVRAFLKDVWRGDVFQAGLRLLEHREELPKILSFLARYFRDALFFSLLGDRSSNVLFSSREDRTCIEELASLGPQALRKSLECLNAFFRDILNNVCWDVAAFHFLLELLLGLRGDFV
ncbi:MAG: DNA polymerase III subunit delta' [Candidatus Caldatribacterium sp.]|uniref:DNA polymerase III subunit delta' n=1 Tax=Candidatus Caldatribacterium sp. TaxID=2282143 RepID=UPI002990D389|nr:DNA polymerase III subunit delta' [Candidatus Caldatribacterium sp.]MCX7731185.1 DNA polymerase III subunit delta' [Candidatus Caldatribacterium sp.]MDW8080859.1 DNA polymerase III subunit delta' [Candidatus Calescibacterium sp.]